MKCSPISDNAFGPQYCDNFDFTLKFEQSVFQITPCALLLFALPFRVSQLRRQEVKCARSWTHLSKQAIISVLALSQCALTISWAVSKNVSRTALAAAVLSFLACLSLLYLSSLEHTRSASPSDIISVFILFSITLDIPQARTLWLRHRSDTAIAATFTACLVIKTVVLLLETRSKRPWLLLSYRAYAPESLANVFNRTVLWWLGPLFLFAYRNNIRFEDLYAIDDTLLSEKVERRFMRYWSRLRKPLFPYLLNPLLTNRIGSGHTGKRHLARAMFSTTKRSLFAIMLPRLCLSAVKLTQPLLIVRLTNWLGEDLRDHNTGKGLIVATMIIYLVTALLNVTYRRQADRFLTTCRGILISVLHSQSLDLSGNQRSDGNTLTLINTDVLRIGLSLQRLGEAFAAPFEVIGVAALLAHQSGVSCVAPIAVGITVAIIGALNTKRGLPMQMIWLDAIQKRIAYTAAVLGCSKGFKTLGLTEFLSKQIQGLRVKELADYAGYRKYVAARETLASVPGALGPTLTLMMFTVINGGGKPTPSVAFSTLSLVSLLSAPVQELVWAIIDFQLAYTSLLRIQSFLLSDDGNNPMPSVDANSASPSIEMTVRTSNGVSLAGATIYAGENSQRTILQDISLDLQVGSLTLVLGPVGSGKSTLLRAVIGDTKLDAGSRTASKDFHSFAFCSQEP
jgi:ATP-binding cassette subfamily C (CFTR/MRP) protein 1